MNSVECTNWVGNWQERIGSPVKLLIRIIAVILLACPLKVSAEDIEVFTTSEQVNANVMFVLDLSGSMNNDPAGNQPVGDNQSRLDIMRDAISDLVTNPNFSNVNIGLMMFRNSAPGPNFPVADLNLDYSTVDTDVPAGTLVKDIIQAQVNGASASGRTPTVEAVYEVARYFRGERPVFGQDRNVTWSNNRNRYEGHFRAYHPQSVSGAVLTVPYQASGYTSSDTCLDYSIDPISPGNNGCAFLAAAGVQQNVCTTYVNLGSPADPGRTCTAETCDAGCGTVQSCPTALVPQPPQSCLTEPGTNTIWYTNNRRNRCCTRSDAGGSECVSTTSIPSVCPVATVQACNTGNHREPTLGTPDRTYQECSYSEQDNRRYVSPIAQQCQQSALVLLTDGDPSWNRADYGRVSSNGNARSPDMIREMIANGDSDPNNSRHDIVCADQSERFGADPMDYYYPNCLIELSRFLHTEDQVPAIPESKIDTYTIGFGLTGPVADSTWSYLQDVAAAGGGQAYTADNLTQLTESFELILAELTGSNQSFRNFSTYLNSSQLETSNRTFLTMFQPGDHRAWSGNLKGYFLLDQQLVDIDGNVATVTSPSTGETMFSNYARSFWTTTDDGNQPLSGGFADNLSVTRKIYTLNSASERGLVNLTDGNHDFETTNTALTRSTLGLADTATDLQRTELIDWVQSERVGDPLHALPKVVEYGGTTGEVLFFMTNQGMLHAVDINEPTTPDGSSAGGDELFAFMPHQMLGTLNDQQNGFSGGHIYGLDGQITVFRDDADYNGIIDNNDRVILIFGMRRGGSTYFALDVTDPTAPRHLWQIRANDVGFESLGQTWSPIKIAKLEDANGTSQKVLVFGGGYDEGQDVAATARDSNGDTVGTGIYIVNLETGALIRSIGNGSDYDISVAGMRYAIPSGIRVVDTDQNGIHDRLYFADLGAQLWRVDIAESTALDANSTYAVTQLADFSTDAAGSRTSQTNRRFFYEPSVARFVRNNLMTFAIAIGSGYRAHPLDNNVQDQVFVIFDANAQKGPPPSSPAPAVLTTANLYDATSNVIQTTSDLDEKATELASLNNAAGWRIELGVSEKVISRVRIFQNQIFFSVFLPEATDPCDITGTTNFLYGLSLTDGIGVLPVYDVDGEATEDQVRYLEVNSQAVILDEPKIVTYHDPGVVPQSTDEEAVAPSSCAGIFAGTQQMMKICSAPEKANWKTLR